MSSLYDCQPAAALMTDFIETMNPIQAGKESVRGKRESGAHTITIDQAKIGGLMVTIVILMVSSFLFTRLESKHQFLRFGPSIVSIRGLLASLYGAGGQFQDQEKDSRGCK